MFSIWCYYLCTCTCVFVCLCECVFSCACDYDRALSAFPNLIGPPPTPGTKIAHLNISFVLIEVREVNEVAGTSTIKFATKREWFDPRLLFQDLVEGKGELTPRESEEIWTPWTTFANLRDKNAWLDTDSVSETLSRSTQPSQTIMGLTWLYLMSTRQSLSSCASLICSGILSTHNLFILYVELPPKPVP